MFNICTLPPEIAVFLEGLFLLKNFPFNGAQLAKYARQLLKKAAQAKPKGLLRLFVLCYAHCREM